MNPYPVTINDGVAEIQVPSVKHEVFEEAIRAVVEYLESERTIELATRGEYVFDLSKLNEKWKVLKARCGGQ